MTKKVAVISQPRYMPSLNYFHRMVLADQFIYLDNVQYTPRDWENRNKLKGPEGFSWLSIPVVRESRDQKIIDTKIDKEQNWPERHIKTIRHFYSRAPYYHEFFYLFEQVYNKNWVYLYDINEEIINIFCDIWDINCSFRRASEAGVGGTGEELLINLCKESGADVYLSGEMGGNYINRENWDKAELDLYFHDYIFPIYPQLFGDFIPWLSALDLLMNCGKAGRQIFSEHQKSLSQR